MSSAGSRGAKPRRWRSKEGEEKLAVLAKGGDAGLQWARREDGVAARRRRACRQAALRKVMTADASKLPAYAGVERGDEGYAIYRIGKVIPAESKAGPQSARNCRRASTGRPAPSSWMPMSRACGPRQGRNQPGEPGEESSAQVRSASSAMVTDTTLKPPST